MMGISFICLFKQLYYQLMIRLISLQQKMKNCQLSCVRHPRFDDIGFTPCAFTLDTLIYSKFLFEQQKYIFKHMKLDGTILAQVQLPVMNVKLCQTINQSSLLIVSDEYRAGQAQFYMWDLYIKQAKKIKTIQYEEHKKRPQIKAFWFSNSRIACLIQQYSDHSIINYFSIGQEHTLDLSSKTFLRNVQAVKLNQHSMIGFAICSANLLGMPLALQMYCLNKNSTIIEQKKLQFLLPIKQLKYSFASYRISDIWEVAPFLLYIQCQSRVQIQRYIFGGSEQKKQFDAKKQQRYYNFYYNYLKNQLDTGLDIPYAHRIQFINSFRPVKLTEIVPNSIGERIDDFNCQHDNFPMSPIQNRGVPIFYLEPYRQNILYMTPAINNQNIQTVFWDANSNKMIEILKNQFKLLQFPPDWRIYKQESKVIFSFLISQLTQHCDEDLLLFVSNLIQGSE